MNKNENTKRIIRGFIKSLAGIILIGNIEYYINISKQLCSPNYDDFETINKDDIENQEKKKRNVVIIAGPGNTAYGQEEIEELYNTISSNTNALTVSLIGDGEKTIKKKDILYKVNTKNNEPLTIIIEMHGTIENNQFYFINGEEKISSAELFSIISKANNKPVDILVTSCHACDCLDDKDLLPEGSLIRSFFTK